MAIYHRYGARLLGYVSATSGDSTTDSGFNLSHHARHLRSANPYLFQGTPALTMHALEAHAQAGASAPSLLPGGMPIPSPQGAPPSLPQGDDGRSPPTLPPVTSKPSNVQGKDGNGIADPPAVIHDGDDGECYMCPSGKKRDQEEALGGGDRNGRTNNREGLEFEGEGEGGRCRKNGIRQG